MVSFRARLGLGLVKDSHYSSCFDLTVVLFCGMWYSPTSHFYSVLVFGLFELNSSIIKGSVVFIS